MGNKNVKSLQKEMEGSPSGNSTQIDGIRSRVYSTASVQSSSTHSRKRAGTRLSMKVKGLRKMISGQNVRQSLLIEQRYRDNIYPKEQFSDNPKFHVKQRKGRKTRVNQNANRPKTAEVNVDTVDISDVSLNLQVRKAKSSFTYDEKEKKKRKIPKPPKNKRIVPRYYSFCEDHPFSKEKDKLNIRCEEFSVLDMTTEQLKKKAIEMILCTINEDVFISNSLFKSKSKTSSGRRLFSSLSAGKNQRKGSNRQINGRLTGGQNRRKSKISKTISIPKNLSKEIKKEVANFVNEIEAKYTDTYYHSFKHAVDVTQMMFMLIFFLNNNLGRIQPFTMIISCLCHDMGHFGANNHFLKNKFLTNNRFIDRFGLESPLEEYHIFLTKNLISNSKLFSPKFMLEETVEEIVTFAETLIINTDMERHNDCLNQAKDDLETERKLVQAGATENVPLPESILILAIKLCDVANVSRNFNDAKRWTDLLSREFKALGTIEKTENIKYLANNVDIEITEEEYEKQLLTKSFIISDQLDSDSLIRFQKHCPDPDFAGCSVLTMEFMKKTTRPMAKLFSDVQGQAGWFLLDRMHTNQESWLASIKDSEENIENIKLV